MDVRDELDDVYRQLDRRAIEAVATVSFYIHDSGIFVICMRLEASMFIWMLYARSLLRKNVRVYMSMCMCVRVRV